MNTRLFCADNQICLCPQVRESTSVQQVLLSACLSCDGCVSESESQKISQQNLDEIKHVLALNKVRVLKNIASINYYKYDLIILTLQ